MNRRINKDVEILCEGNKDILNSVGGDENIKTPDDEVKNENGLQAVNEKCAPSKKYEDGSCLTLKTLIGMAKQYNKFIDNPEKYSGVRGSAENIIRKRIEPKWDPNIPLSKKKYRKYLLKELEDRLKSVCDNQLCWLKLEFMKRIEDGDLKREIYQETYRPIGPKGRFKWLSTTNVNKVMYQYEKDHPEFKFLGTVPIDFDDIPVGIKELNFNELYDKGTKKLGCVFNLDEHYKSGSHWVSMFADLDGGNVEFFDSYGIKPDRRIMKLMQRISNACKERGLNSVISWNKNRHQFKNSECGVYSMNYIIRRLAGEKEKDITQNAISDEQINKCRDVYFR